MENFNIPTLELNVEQAVASGDYEKIITSYIQLGQAHMKSGDTPKGLSQIEEALKIVKDVDMPEIEARLLGFKGMALREIGNFAEAIKAFRKSLKISRKIGNTVLESDALLQIGNLLAEQGKNLEAISKLDNALYLAIENSDKPRILFISNILGNIFFSIEAYEKAVETYALVLETAKFLGDKKAEAACLIHIGRTFLMDGGYEGAMEHFEMALDISGQIGNDPIETQALRGLMQANQKQEKKTMALVYGEQVVSRAKIIPDPYLELLTLQDICEMLVSDEKYGKLIPHLERCVVLADQLNDQITKMETLSDLGTAHYFLENFESASTYLLEAMELAILFRNTDKEAELSGRLSALKADQGELAASNEFAINAINLAQQLELPRLKGEQLIILALNSHEVGNRDQAVAYCETAVEVFSGLGETGLADQAKTFLENF